MKELNPQSLKVGDLAEVKAGDITPAQPDDGHYSRSIGPVRVYVDGTELRILDGNHRYYDVLREQGKNGELTVRVVKNPYLDY